MEESAKVDVRPVTWWEEQDQFELWQALMLAGLGESPDEYCPHAVDREKQGDSVFDDKGHFAPGLRGRMRCIGVLADGSEQLMHEEEIAREAVRDGGLKLLRENGECFLKSTVERDVFFAWAAETGFLAAEKYRTGLYHLDGTTTFEYWRRRSSWELWQGFVLLHGRLPDRFEPYGGGDRQRYGGFHAWVTMVSYPGEGRLRGALDGETLQKFLEEDAQIGELNLIERAEEIMESKVKPEVFLRWAESRGVEIPPDIHEIPRRKAAHELATEASARRNDDLRHQSWKIAHDKWVKHPEWKMGKMAWDVYNRLIAANPGRKIPKDSTIRRWLRDGERAAKITIPDNARKPGKSKQTHS